MHFSENIVKNASDFAAQGSAAPRRKRILIVDDHAIMREGLDQIISREPDLVVCGQTDDAFAALELAASTKPDLAIVDIMINGKPGLELIKDLHMRHPRLMVLVLSMHAEMGYAERVLRAGAHGYVMKEEGGERLIEAIRQVLGGEIAVSRKVAEQLVGHLAHGTPNASPLAGLTDRELEIFELTGQGKDSSAIAGMLHISPKTVESHRARIKEKLQIATTAELISMAARWKE